MSGNLTFYEVQELNGYVTDRNKLAVRIVSDELDALYELAKNCRDAGILRMAFLKMADGILTGNDEKRDSGHDLLERDCNFWENDERKKIEPFVFDETEKGGNFSWRVLKNNDGTICHISPRDMRALSAIESLRRQQEETALEGKKQATPDYIEKLFKDGDIKSDRKTTIRGLKLIARKIKNITKSPITAEHLKCLRQDGDIEFSDSSIEQAVTFANQNT